MHSELSVKELYTLAVLNAGLDGLYAPAHILAIQICESTLRLYVIEFLPLTPDADFFQRCILIVFVICI